MYSILKTVSKCRTFSDFTTLTQRLQVTNTGASRGSVKANILVRGPDGWRTQDLLRGSTPTCSRALLLSGNASPE